MQGYIHVLEYQGKWIMLETRFTEFPTLFCDPRVEISRSASETYVLLFFLPMALIIVIYYLSFLSFLTFNNAKQPLPNVFHVFALVQK